MSHLDQRQAQRCRFWCALLNHLHQFSLLVVTFLSISASAALSLLCFGGPLDLLGSELGHPMFLSRVRCILDVYWVKGSLFSTCCGIPLIFPLCPPVLETYNFTRYPTNAFKMGFLFDSISAFSVFMSDVSTFLSLLFTFKLYSFDSLVHPKFSPDSLKDSSVLLLSSSSTSSSDSLFLCFFAAFVSQALFLVVLILPSSSHRLARSQSCLP